MHNTANSPGITGRGPVEGRRPETRASSGDGIAGNILPKREGRSPVGENQGRSLEAIALVVSILRLIVEVASQTL